MANELTTQDWYQHLVEECKAIITEAVFTSRWALVEGYWTLGKRIRTDLKWQKYSQGLYTSQDLANAIGISERTLDYALQTYDNYQPIDKIPEGKNISWNKLITKYLTKHTKDSPPLPEGKYQVIYADPPWPYTNMQHGIDEQETTLDNHYPTMSISDICNLSVRELSGDNSVLFIWTTSPFLEDTFTIIDAWGFEYKASIIWDKVKHNVGYYVSVRHEFLLICTRGSCLPDNPKLYDSVQTIERSNTHSQKPEAFYKIIEDLYRGKKIELFARNKREGWEAWGNEL